MSERFLSISAGTLRGAPPAQAAAAAAAAGFDALGVRFDTQPPSAGDLRSLRNQLDASGLAVLDVEVIRIAPGDDAEATKRLTEWGAMIGARYLLVVSDEPDRGRTVERFAETCEIATDRGMRIVLEFMQFTSVPTIDDALDVVRAASSPGAGVLVDALHLARSGGVPSALIGLEPSLLPYVQLCDAPAEPDRGMDHLADEARHDRLMPGSGGLPLGDLLGALAPDIPLAVEVLSDAADVRPRTDVALDAMAATRRVLSEVPADTRPSESGDGMTGDERRSVSA